MQSIIQRMSILAAAVVLAPGATPVQAKPPAFEAVARADHTDIQLGQSVLVIVEAKGAEGKPDITIPKAEDCAITLAGRALQSPAFAGLNRKKLLTPGASLSGQDLAESLRRMTEQLSKEPLLDPGLLKGMGDTDLQKQLQAALGNVGGAKGNDQALAYHVHAKRAGAIVVPPFTVTADGQTATTKPIELHVSPTRSQGYVRLALSLSDPRPLVGQEVHLNIDVLVRREQVRFQNQSFPHLPLKSVQLTLPPLDAGPLEFVKPLREVLKEHAPPPGHRGYRVNHLPGEAVFDKDPNAEKDELGWYRRRLEIPVRVKKAGKFTLPQAGVAGDVYARTASVSRRAPGRWTPFVATSDPVNYEVRELPAIRPRDFRGNIGALRVTTQASQTKMTTGTPFTLTARLEGDGHLPPAGSLDLAADTNFTKRFRVRAENDRALSDTLREITYTLRPFNAQVKEVPPVSVSYFDSKADEFKAAKSEPIPLEVSGPPLTNPETPETATHEPAETTGDDLPPLEDLVAANQRGLFTRNLLPAAVLIAALAVVAGVLAGGRVRRARRRWRTSQLDRAALREQQQAAGEVRRQLAGSMQSVHEVRELVQSVLRARFGLPSGEITAREAGERLRQAGIPAELASRCVELLTACAAAEFAPGVNPASLPELTARAERLTAELANVAA